ncbi:MAG: hypothetical protein HY721_32710 [Planctomycetes bacterium]|nr:hypothetical protein [Planctomycetota bacterium]
MERARPPAGGKEAIQGPRLQRGGPLEALRPDVEEALGEKLGEPVVFVPATRKDVANVIAAENAEILAEVEGGPRGEALEEACEAQARAFAKILFAKIDVAKGVVLVVPENFEAQAAALGDAGGRLLSPEFLDLLLVHESIHAFQERRFGLRKVFGRPRSQDELTARMSVVEGHAQLVERKVAEKRGLKDAFLLHEEVVTGVPPSVKDPAERLILETLQQFLAFPYTEGHKFLATLERKLGYAKALERAFKTPPATLRAVSHPDEYLSPPKVVLDLRKLAEKGAGLLDEDKYKTQVIALPANALRQGCLLAGKEAVEKAFRPYRASAVVVGSALEGMPGSQFGFTLIELTDEAGAKGFLELEELVARKKDEQFKAPGGLAQIVSAEYERLEGPDAPCLYVEKTLKLAGQEKQNRVRSLLIGHRRFVIEVMGVYTTETRDELLTLGRRLKKLIDEDPLARAAEAPAKGKAGDKRKTKTKAKAKEQEMEEEKEKEKEKAKAKGKTTSKPKPKEKAPEK